MDIEKLKTLINDYKYDKFDVIEKIDITYDLKNKQVILDNFFYCEQLPRNGTCFELMNTAFYDIRKNNPELFVYRAIGTEPEFFRRLLSRHAYLLISEEELMDPNMKTKDKEQIKEITCKDPIVFDPSFQKVDKLSCSEYKVRKLFGPNRKIIYESRQVLMENHKTPLGFNSIGELFSLTANFNYPSILRIGFTKPRDKYFYHYSLNSPKLEHKISNDQKILKFVKLLREKEMLEIKIIA